MRVAFFLICAVLSTFDPVKANTSNVNATSTTIVVRWAIVSALAILIYRLYSEESILFSKLEQHKKLCSKCILIRN